MCIAAEINKAATYKVGVEADFVNQTVSCNVVQADSMVVAESVNQPARAVNLIQMWNIESSGRF